jgi:peptide deformylase
MTNIVTAPSEVLSQKAKPVTKIDEKLIDEMKQILLLAKDPEGVGLAAPQIGKPLSIFIIKPTLKSPIKVFINPKIIEETDKSPAKSDPTEAGKKPSHPSRLEGCLSLPNIWGDVRRKPLLTLSFLDEKGKSHTQIFKGFIAIIIQHEIDHLNGVLFTKRVLEQNGQLYKSYKNEEGEDVFEEIEI